MDEAYSIMKKTRMRFIAPQALHTRTKNRLGCYDASICGSITRQRK